MKIFPINSRLIVEFISVSFAVILALMVNQWRDNRNNNMLARKSVENIKKEMSENSSSMKLMVERHTRLMHEIDSVLNLMEDENSEGEMDISLDFEIISNTAWEATQLTEAISYIDFELTMEISAIYQIQDYYQSMIKDFILRNMYVISEYSDQEQDKFLITTFAFLNTLLPIEKNLVTKYDKILDKLSEK